MKNDYKKIFLGENKYTTGLLFTFASMMGFFSHMRKINFDDSTTYLVIIVIVIVACQLSKL